MWSDNASDVGTNEANCTDVFLVVLLMNEF